MSMKNARSKSVDKGPGNKSSKSSAAMTMSMKTAPGGRSSNKSSSSAGATGGRSAREVEIEEEEEDLSVIPEDDDAEISQLDISDDEGPDNDADDFPELEVDQDPSPADSSQQEEDAEKLLMDDDLLQADLNQGGLDLSDLNMDLPGGNTNTNTLNTNNMDGLNRRNQMREVLESDDQDLEDEFAMYGDLDDIVAGATKHETATDGVQAALNSELLLAQEALNDINPEMLKGMEEEKKVNLLRGCFGGFDLICFRDYFCLKYSKTSKS